MLNPTVPLLQVNTFKFVQTEYQESLYRLEQFVLTTLKKKSAKMKMLDCYPRYFLNTYDMHLLKFFTEWS